MDPNKKAELIEAGINVDGALERFMGNEKLLDRYLNRFLTEKSYAALDAAIKSDDQAAAATAVHTLKSVCGSIGCDALFEQVVNQEKAIRSDRWSDAVAMMPDIEASYQKICAALQAK